MREQPDFERYEGTDRVSVARCGPTLVTYSFDAHRVEELEALESANERQGTLYPAGHSSLVIVTRKALGTISEDVRVRSIRLVKKLEPRLQAQGFALLGSGFAAATTRLIVSTIFLVSGSKVPHKAFSQLAAAAHWLAEQDSRVQLAALLEAAQTLTQGASTQPSTRSDQDLGYG